MNPKTAAAAIHNCCLTQMLQKFRHWDSNPGRSGESRRSDVPSVRFAMLPHAKQSKSAMCAAGSATKHIANLSAKKHFGVGSQEPASS